MWASAWVSKWNNLATALTSVINDFCSCHKLTPFYDLFNIYHKKPAIYPFLNTNFLLQFENMCDIMQLYLEQLYRNIFSLLLLFLQDTELALGVFLFIYMLSLKKLSGLQPKASSRIRFDIFVFA